MKKINFIPLFYLDVQKKGTIALRDNKYATSSTISIIRKKNSMHGARLG
jgi:hypothetical protein